MSEIGGFDWWFRDRDYVLRDSVETLYAESAAASRRASRISSRLSKVQGTIESRLNALTKAFDAYVELGDVREELAAFADSSVVRREAMTAIGSLGEGHPAARVDDRDTGYWIAPATNAVIDRVAGAPDLVSEQRLADQQPVARLFIMAATASVGRAAEVAEQAVALLRPVDGRLDHHQLIIWRAMRAGVFGPDVWQRVATDWAAELHPGAAGGDAGVWWSWASDRARAGGADVLDWLEAQPGAAAGSGEQLVPVEPSASGVEQESEPDGLAELKEIVVELIGAGVGEEAALLARARELRRRIEDPHGAADRDAGTDARDPGAAVTELVQQAYQDSAPGGADRATLYTLIAPALSAGLEEQASSFLTAAPATVKVTVPGGPVEVTPNGPEQATLARHVAATKAMQPTGGRALLVAGVVAAAAAIIALIGVIAGQPALAVLMLIVAVIAGVVALRNWITQRQERQGLAERQRSWSEKLAEAQQRARRIETEQRDIRRSRADQLDRLRQQLDGRPMVRPVPER